MGPDRLEQYTKKQKIIPVGDTVAVQNQTGRFPKKWDKTGTVVENQDYDKVLVKLDGSGRLTTRNRRFVKKIVSPPDPSQIIGPQAQTTHVIDHDEAIPDVSGNDTPGHIVDRHSEVFGNDLTEDQISHENQGEEQSGINDMMNDRNDDMIVQPERLQNDRPKRDRRQNVRYSPEEYDLSEVSTNTGKSKLILSSIFVQPKDGKLMKKRTN